MTEPSSEPARDYVRALFRPPPPVPEVDDDGRPVEEMRLFTRRLFAREADE